MLEAKNNEAVNVALSLLDVSAQMNRDGFSQRLPPLLIRPQAHHRVTGDGAIHGTAEHSRVHGLQTEDKDFGSIGRFESTISGPPARLAMRAS